MITAGELKNWAYCPRVVYYRRRLGASSVATYKMKAGLDAQQMIERFEMRRSLGKYGFEDARRTRDLWLVDEELGLNGRVDYLLESEDEAAIVDFKLTASEPGDNHRLQLAAYAWLVERRLAKPVRRCFIYRIPDDRVFEVVIDERLRAWRTAALVQIRDLDELPEATAVRGRCTDCEYLNFCADIW